VERLGRGNVQHGRLYVMWRLEGRLSPLDEAHEARTWFLIRRRVYASCDGVRPWPLLTLASDACAHEPTQYITRAPSWRRLVLYTASARVLTTLYTGAHACTQRRRVEDGEAWRACVGWRGARVWAGARVGRGEDCGAARSAA
jgi:hypothetical protein